MKTLKELNEMKNKKTDMFGTHFNFIIQNAVNNLVSKSNGVNRVLSELSDWNLEAKEEIIKNIENVLINYYSENNWTSQIQLLRESLK